MRNKNGFTLIELAVVILVLAAVLAFTVPAVLDVLGGTKKILKGYEKDSLLDAAKYYVTDIDEGKVELRYTGTSPITINGHTYYRNQVFSKYDAKVYLIEQNGMDITVETLVKGGYYDKDCRYAGTVISYKEKVKQDNKYVWVDKTKRLTEDQSCTAPKNCKIHVGIVGRRVEGDKYYVSDNYTAELRDGCELN